MERRWRRGAKGWRVDRSPSRRISSSSLSSFSSTLLSRCVSRKGGMGGGFFCAKARKVTKPDNEPRGRKESGGGHLPFPASLPSSFSLAAPCLSYLFPCLPAAFHTHCLSPSPSRSFSPLPSPTLTRTPPPPPLGPGPKEAVEEHGDADLRGRRGGMAGGAEEVA